ncbi:hypothetical protein AAL_04553 [Moelleriella libera RCEF 2490]|uniref:Uncharacterized protein n=1 Tax=Moelleriella libera RCEF 2490 TaxID=1081109 RepID=A0A162IK08_9HYPO|nr:hypothetical protein AAL_04553 [Moelleriella libera RCEF 2490]
MCRKQSLPPPPPSLAAAERKSLSHVKVEEIPTVPDDDTYTPSQSLQSSPCCVSPSESIDSGVGLGYTAMDVEMPYRVYALVQKGALLDSTRKRRLGLWFIPQKPGSEPYCFLVRGIHETFKIKVKASWNPLVASRLLPLASAGNTKNIGFARLKRMLYNVAVDKLDEEFDAYHWIWHSLDALVEAGHLEREAVDRTFASLLDVTLDDGDDDDDEEEEEEEEEEDSGSGEQ